MNLEDHACAGIEKEKSVHFIGILPTIQLSLTVGVRAPISVLCLESVPLWELKSQLVVVPWGKSGNGFFAVP